MDNTNNVNDSVSTKVAPKAGLREWIGLAVLALACLLYVMDLTVLQLAVPSLSADLDPSSVQLLWIIDIYGFMVAGFLITMGTLGDRIGRRKLLLIGAACFGVISIAAAFSRSANMLILCRALLGIAGATLAPSTLSLIFSMFRDPKQRAIAISIWISAFSAGSAVGPVLGGVLLEHFWWGSVFLLSIPVIIPLLILGPRVLPEYKNPNPGRLDFLSVFMVLFSILSIIFGLKEIAQNGVSIFSIISIILGFLMGYVFVRRQLLLTDPLIDLRLFVIPAFRASLLVNILTVFVSTGYFLFIAQYLQLVIGLSPLHAGLWSIPSAIGFILGSQIVPRIASKVRPSYIISVGLGLAAVGLLILTRVGDLNGFTSVVVASVIISLGLAPVFGLTTEMIVGSAPPERAGVASGMSETASELGGALGISILGSIGVAIYRHQLTDSLPVAIPPQIAAVAKDTLGAAVGVSHQLPAEMVSQFLTIVRTAFVRGMVVAATISMIIAVTAVFIAIIVLRKVEKRSD